MQDVQAEGVMMRGWASMCLCEWASMCPCKWESMCLCEWACVRASEMGRCDNHEGVGIHVGGSRWNPCENVQVGMDVMSARGHMAMQVGQGGIHAGICRPAAGGNPWMWVGCMLSMVGVNTVRCCYI